MDLNRENLIRLALVVLLIAAAALPWFASTYHVQLATKVLLLGIVAMALNLVVGFGGLVSMCHGAFYGIGGYTLALMAPQYAPASLWLTLPAAIVAAGLAALAIGALSLRTRGVYFIMVTLAFGEMLFYLFHDTKIAGGSDGTFINLRPEAVLFGINLVDLEKPRTLFWVTLGFAVATIALLEMLVRSPFGRALCAARDNERRARSLGFSIYRLRLMAFTLSGAISGLGGYFAAAQFGYVAPQFLGWHVSATLLVIVVIGGMRWVTGPLLGAIVIIGLEELLQIWIEYWKLAMGLIIIALVLAVPGGARDLLDRVFPERREAAKENDVIAPGAKLAGGSDG